MSDEGLIPVPDDLDLGVTIRGFAVGQMLFSRYRLIDLVGRGGMGVVWKARDEKLEQDVALKFLPEIVKLDATTLDDLKRETRRSLQLTHGNIVRIYDFLENSQVAGISMEFIDGASLSALRVRQANRVFSVDEIKVWVGQLCRALEYAHEDAMVIHRDIKPANLMVTLQGKLKVTDFGVSRSISDSVSRVTVNKRGGTSGTLYYMSPQQLMGEDPSAADDIYALGATLYELLTSKPPFYTGEITMQIKDKIPSSMAQRRAVLGVEAAPIPEHWEKLVAECLAKNPRDRPASMADIAERLSITSTQRSNRPSMTVVVPKKTDTAKITISAASISTIASLERRASGGEIKAQVELGHCYFYGQDTAQNYELALDWYIKAAEQRDVEAQFRVGYMYHAGLGTSQDFEIALGWYRKAADRGSADAMLKLGNMYEHGQGIQANAARAVEWYTRASEESNQEATVEMRRLKRSV